jgi:Family of unknown function (DUF7010)
MSRARTAARTELAGFQTREHSRTPRTGKAQAEEVAMHTWTIDTARDEISASSAGGAPFLYAFAGSLIVCAILGLLLPLKTAALILLFQGNAALPIAFWLERRMGRGPMSNDNPLKSLSVLMAMSQVAALPAALIAYSRDPWLVPAALAAIGGGHFLPYAWLQRTRVYAVLGVAISVGALAITLVLRDAGFPWVLIYMAVLYVAGGIAVRSRARELSRAARAAA